MHRPHFIIIVIIIVIIIIIIIIIIMILSSILNVYNYIAKLAISSQSGRHFCTRSTTSSNRWKNFGNPLLVLR